MRTSASCALPSEVLDPGVCSAFAQSLAQHRNRRWQDSREQATAASAGSSESGCSQCVQLFYLHVHKTGGSSIEEWMKAALPEGIFFDDPAVPGRGSRSFRHRIDNALSMLESNNATMNTTTNMYILHDTFGRSPRLMNDTLRRIFALRGRSRCTIRIGTSLRSPSSHLFSWFNWEHQHLHGRRYANFTSFLSQARRCQRMDSQAAFFAGLTSETRDRCERSEPPMTVQTLLALLANFDYLGITEDLHNTFRWIKAELSRPSCGPPTLLSRANWSKDRQIVNYGMYHRAMEQPSHAKILMPSTSSICQAAPLDAVIHRFASMAGQAEARNSARERASLEAFDPCLNDSAV